MDKEKLKQYSFYTVITLIILLGFIIRLKFLLDNPSFWFDESALGFNILTLNFLDFFKILHLQQVAPPLFMCATKLITNIFGQSDLIFRILPFVIGNLSIIIFYLILREYFQSKLNIVIGLSLFIFNPQVTKYCVEFKPYILELFFTCLLFYIFTKLDWKNSYKKLFTTGCILAITPWFAFSTWVILMSGFVLKFSKQFYKKWLTLILPSFFSGILFCIYYLNVKHFYNNFMGEFFKYSFFNLKDLPLQFVISLKYLFDLNYSFYPVILIFLGIFCTYLNKKYAFLRNFSILTIGICIIASLLKIYLFYDRFILFLFPLFLLLILPFFEKLAEFKKGYTTFLLIILFVVLFIPNLYFGNRAFTKKFDKSSCARELFEDMSDRLKPNDSIIVDTLSSSDFLYFYKYHNFKNKVNLNIEIVDGVIKYIPDRDVNFTIDDNTNTWIYAAWPSRDYSNIKSDYKKVCELNSGLILYSKGKN